MRERPIPDYVDDPMQVFFWEVDEFVTVMAIFLTLYVMGQAGLGLILMIVLSNIFARMKTRQMPGFLFHLSFWHGVMPLNRRFTNGLLREFVV